MRFRLIAFLAAGMLASTLPGHSQQAGKPDPGTVIRTETKLVLVDAVVTDKKGNHVTDLTQKDFKVQDDGKDQAIKTFSFEADPASPTKDQKHYLVLFFDNASAGYGDQMQARNAASKFIDTNVGPNKFIAIANFTGTLRISQNFTNDADRLKQVVGAVKSSSVSTSDDTAATGGLPSLSSAASDFGVRSVLLALRSLAKSLESVQGRKTVVFLSGGFPLTTETRAELTATVDECNRANVAVYPVDLRGLTAPPMFGDPTGGRGIIREKPLAEGGNGLSGRLAMAGFGSFVNSFQRGGGGAGGAGSSGSAGSSSGGGSRGGSGSTGGGTGAGSSGGGVGAGSGSAGGGGRTGSFGNGNLGGGRSGNTGGVAPGSVGNRTGGNNGNNGGGGVTNPSMMNRNLNPFNNPRNILPPFNSGLDINEQALYMLADGTGGFVIHNTNDLAGGMEKIARDQGQYYILGYSPVDSPEGSCHTLKVKVDRGGTTVRSRTGYCNVHQVDPLAGKPIETELETIASSSVAGKLSAPLELPYFYASPNVARVNVAMEIPASTFKFDKVKGKQHTEVNILGVATKADGSVAAKFSDTIKRDFESKDEVTAFTKEPLHYENQFEIAAGNYHVKVVFSAGGENFGKLEKDLAIDTFNGKEFALSGLALSHHRTATREDSGLDAVLVDDRVPLVAKGVQFVPAGSTRFKKDEDPGLYLEVYEPLLLEDKPVKLAAQLRILDRKTGEVKLDSGLVSLDGYVQKGSALVPVGLKIPLDKLAAGSYRVELAGFDDANHMKSRSVDMDVE
jgi:VWFA-related protein